MPARHPFPSPIPSPSLRRETAGSGETRRDSFPIRTTSRKNTFPVSFFAAFSPSVSLPSAGECWNRVERQAIASFGGGCGRKEEEEAGRCVFAIEVLRAMCRPCVLRVCGGASGFRHVSPSGPAQRDLSSPLFPTSCRRR